MAVCRFAIFIENIDKGGFFFKVGKVADMLVLGEKRWEHLVYQVLLSLSTICFHVFSKFSHCMFFFQLGSRDVIRHVVKKGTVVV